MMDLCQAEEYIKCGLADSVLYKDEMIAYLKQLTGRKEDQSLNSLFLEDMINVKRMSPRIKVETLLPYIMHQERF